MKTIHKVGQRIWSLILLGRSIPFDRQIIKIETCLPAHSRPYHWLHYTRTEGRHVTTISEGSTDIDHLRECFYIGFYTAKQGHRPDLL